MDPRIALSYYPLPQDSLADLERVAGGQIRNVVVSALRARHAIDIHADIDRRVVEAGNDSLAPGQRAGHIIRHGYLIKSARN